MEPTVALIDPVHPVHGRGGAPTYVRAHARAARAAGFAPRVFCAAPRSRVLRTEVAPVHEVAAPGPPEHLTLPLHAGRLAEAVVAFGLTRPRHEPLVVHGFGPWGCVAVAACRRLEARGWRAVPVTSAYTLRSHETAGKLHALGPHHRLGDRARIRLDHLLAHTAIRLCERRAWRGAWRILVNYESVRTLLLARHPVAAKIVRVPYTSDLAFLAAPAPLRPAAGRGPLRLVCLARHDARKGIDVLLRAVAALRGAPPVHLRLIGGGPLLAVHRRLAERLGIARAVELSGWVEDPAPRLREADLFVLPSLEEGSGSLALVEALHAGLPVVASRVDGIGEDVADGESALLVPPGDLRALAAAIARAADPALRARLARGGRAVFARRFSPQVFAGALGRIYAEATGAVPLTPPGGSAAAR